MGNLGVHEVDIGRWFAGHATLPPRVISFGGRFGFNDAGETPNTHFALFDYDSIPVMLELRNLPLKPGMKAMDVQRKIRAGSIVQCEHGYLTGSRGGAVSYDNAGKRLESFPGDGGGGHQRNFIDAIRSRKQTALAAPLQEGFISSGLTQLGAISYRTGQPAPVSQIKEAVGKNQQALETVERIEQHLKTNKIDLAKTPMTLGPWLTLDQQREKVIASKGGSVEAANALLKDAYRPGFVVPESV